VHVATAAMQGEGKSGWVDLHLFTAEGQPNYATLLSPEGVHGLAQSLLQAVQSMPTPPPINVINLGGRLQGRITYGPQTKTYFGDTYSLPVIQAMGVLMIRANLLDQRLIDLSAALTGATIAQATNQYYASVNMKARLDSIRAILPVSEISDLLISQIEGDSIKKASDRRNDLVHARWNSRKGKHRAVIYKPNAKVKTTEVTVNEKHVLDIAEAFAGAHALLITGVHGVREARKPASNTAATLSSTEPES
jgi:hypothetical protein